MLWNNASGELLSNSFADILGSNCDNSFLWITLLLFGVFVVIQLVLVSISIGQINLLLQTGSRQQPPKTSPADPFRVAPPTCGWKLKTKRLVKHPEWISFHRFDYVTQVSDPFTSILEWRDFGALFGVPSSVASVDFQIRRFSSFTIGVVDDDGYTLLQPVMARRFETICLGYMSQLHRYQFNDIEKLEPDRGEVNHPMVDQYVKQFRDSDLCRRVCSENASRRVWLIFCFRVAYFCAPVSSTNKAFDFDIEPLVSCVDYSPYEYK